MFTFLVKIVTVMEIDAIVVSHLLDWKFDVIQVVLLHVA